MNEVCRVALTFHGFVPYWCLSIIQHTKVYDDERRGIVLLEYCILYAINVQETVGNDISVRFL